MNRKHLLEISLGLIGVIQSLLLLPKAIKKNKTKPKKRIWSRNWLLQRNMGKDISHLIFEELGLDDPVCFKNFCRMDVESFYIILEEIRPWIEKQDTNMREAIPAKTRLLIALRYLATGEKFQSLSYSFRVSVSAISQIVKEANEAIYNALKDEFLKCPDKKEEWLKISEEFESQWNFPFCLGALDGKHIAFRASKEDGSYYFNYKGFNSIILLALVDANYKFLFVDVGSNGRVHDARVFSESQLYKMAILNNDLNIPESGILPGTNHEVPYVFLGDEAFPLKTKIMKPLKHRSNEREKIFNYRLSRTRRVVENAFGILSNRFHVLQTEINLKVEKVEQTVLTCCALHNFLREKEGQKFLENVDLEIPGCTIQQGCWRNQTYGTNLQKNNVNRSSNEALQVQCN